MIPSLVIDVLWVGFVYGGSTVVTALAPKNIDRGSEIANQMDSHKSQNNNLQCDQFFCDAHNDSVLYF